VIDVDVKHRAAAHGDKKGQIICLQVTTGDDQIIVAEPSGDIVIPQGFTFFVRHGKNFHNGVSFSAGISSL
jgi:hypothetical protein